MAMLAVLMCVIVVISLSAVAVQQTVGSLSQTAQGRNLLQTVDAASAGIQAELAVLKDLQAAPAGTTIPCTNGRVTVATAVDPAGVASYTLSMTAPSSTQPAANPSVLACATNSFSVPSADPYYVLVQSVGTNAAVSHNNSTGRTLQALIEVFDSSAAPASSTTTTSSTTVVSTSSTTAASTTTAPSTTTTVPATTTTTVASGFYDSAASAQVVNLSLAGTTAFAYTNPAYSATNGGFNSSAAVTLNGSMSVPNGDSYLTATGAGETVEANTDGSSYACAGVLSGTGSISGGASNAACSTSGNASGGVSLNIYGLPGISSVLTSLIGGLTLNFDAATCWAADNAGGTSPRGSASLLNAYVTVKLLGLSGLSVNVPLNLSASVTAQTNLLTVMTNAMAGNVLLGAALATNIYNALSPLLTLTANYETLNNGVFTATALHVGLIGQTGSAELATCSVGPNSSYIPSTTTTTSTTSPATSTTTTTIPSGSTTTTVAPATTTTVLLPNEINVIWVRQVA